MRITAVSGEKDVAELVTRLYGKLSKARTAIATDALLEANPQLGAAAPSEGMVLVVPDTADLTLHKQSGVENDVTTQMMQNAAAAVTAFQTRLSAVAKAETAKVAANAKLLKSAETKRLVKEMPALKAHVTRVEKALKARQTGLKQVQSMAGKGAIAIERKDA